MEIVVIGSARKHGIADEDMVHAIGNHQVAIPEHDDFVMRIGTDAAGRWLEVGTVDTYDLRLVVHAMKARPKYLKFLR